ncbi:uncharacterized protein PAC_15131 [Phialocephala subalpina]|uniref:SprT-like domain-containing protein n=1 Tax=Phialocephala subalpina TaxID=576137 RepID=A0A1L7XJL1_9HELO|nr:uncharacterized protein PAC_15131 [Phialocephala subalpina]
MFPSTSRGSELQSCVQALACTFESGSTTSPGVPQQNIRPFCTNKTHRSFHEDVNSSTLQKKSYIIDDVCESLCNLPDTTGTGKNIKDRLGQMEVRLLQQLLDKADTSLEIRPGGNSQDTRTALQTLAKTYYPIFNKMLFGGLLTDYVANFVAYNIEELRKQDSNSEVVLRDTRGFYQDNTRTIHLNLKPISLSLVATPKQAYIAALIHEMLHAYFWAYACKCANWCYQDQLLQNTFGKTFHEVAWIPCMVAIARVLGRDLNWRVDLGIALSLEAEEEASGYAVPAELLAIWSLYRVNMGGVRVVC